MFLLTAALLVAADQLTKLWAANAFPLGGQGRYIGFGFYLTYVRNTGAAFGIFENGTLVLGILSAVVSLAILAYLLSSARRMPRLQLIALTLVMSGAVGNMIDRFWLGYVRDFIHFRVPNFNFPVFNVADSCVVVGAILLLSIGLFGKEGHPGRGPDVPAEASDMPDADYYPSQGQGSTDNPNAATD
ncbi:MAG TPA: signal peptidase II [Trueperaceae bacterium]